MGMRIEPFVAGPAVPPYLGRRRRPIQALLVFALSILTTVAIPAADKRRDAAAAPAEAATASSAAKGFDAFQLIVERNIFNPNRTGRTRSVPEEKPPRIDEIALVGTMQYDKGLVAFFHSTDAAFRKTVREGETIDEFKVGRITADGIELRRGEETIALKVAQQLRRAEGGDWAVVSSPDATMTARDGSAEGGAGPARSAAAPVEIPADASEVLKRLMKKREKQLK